MVSARPEALEVEHGPPPVWAGLLTIYVIWGSTYLAIGIVVQTMPPLLAAAVRFGVAGGALMLWALRRGATMATVGRAQWRAAAIVGGLLLCGGNGGVSWAEQTLPSGIVALIIAAVPLWMAVLDRVVHGRTVPMRGTVGVIVGFVGVALLVDPSADGFALAPFLVALAAALCWAWGSLWSRTAPLPDDGLLATGMEMLCGGGVLAVAGVLTGEPGRIDIGGFSRSSLLALLYLVVFGSLVAFTA